MHTLAKRQPKRIELPFRPAGRALRLSKFRQRIAAVAREKFKVEPFQSVTDWAAENRYLSQTGAEFGKYRPERCPYQKAIQDAFNDPQVREITWQSAERVGKSTVAANILGFIIDKAPCSVLWTMPSREAVADFLKDELEPMFSASPLLRAKLKAGATGSGRTNNIRRKTFQGGVATFVGGGSSLPVAFRTVKVVVLDEVDKLKPLPEGDADALAAKRVSTFGADYKILRFSKPTEEGSSRINRHFLRGTQSCYFLSCPRCHQFQEPGWALLRFDDVKMRCTSCNEFFTQDEWLEGDGGGEWRESANNPHHKSFQNSALISPLIRWETLISEYREAIGALESGDNSLIRVFENSRLGQVFGGRVERVDPQELYARREFFGEQASPLSVIPEGTVATTLGIDTQNDGFFYVLAAFGRKMETWLPLTGRITGDMRSAEPWAELVKVLETTWLDKDGNGYRPVISAIDCQGDFYAEVLAFIKPLTWRLKLRAVRGWADRFRRGAGAGIGLLRNSFVDKSTLVRVQNLDTDSAKSVLATMLARTNVGPGFVHLPSGKDGQDVGGWDYESVAELTAEYRRQMPSKGGYTHFAWFKRPGRPNHRLDCSVYCLAALAMSRLRIDDCNLQRTEARELEKQKSQHKSGSISATVGVGSQFGAINNPATGAEEVSSTPSPRGESPFGARQGVNIWRPDGF